MNWLTSKNTISTEAMEALEEAGLLKLWIHPGNGEKRFYVQSKALKKKEEEVWPAVGLTVGLYHTGHPARVELAGWEGKRLANNRAPRLYQTKLFFSEDGKLHTNWALGPEPLEQAVKNAEQLSDTNLDPAAED